MNLRRFTNVECRMRNSKCGIRNAGCGIVANLKFDTALLLAVFLITIHFNTPLVKEQKTAQIQARRGKRGFADGSVQVVRVQGKT